jgi:hypothetical protein
MIARGNSQLEKAAAKLAHDARGHRKHDLRWRVWPK